MGLNPGPRLSAPAEGPPIPALALNPPPGNASHVRRWRATSATACVSGAQIAVNQSQSSQSKPSALLVLPPLPSRASPPALIDARARITQMCPLLAGGFPRGGGSPFDLMRPRPQPCPNQGCPSSLAFPSFPSLAPQPTRFGWLSRFPTPTRLGPKGDWPADCI